MNIRPFTITPVPGGVSVPFAEDFRIEIAYRDPRTDEVVADYTGENAPLASELLASLPAEVLALLVFELAQRLVAIAKGLG